MGNNELTGVIYSILVEKTKGTLLRNWDDLDLWMLAESVEGSVSQQPIELNENQQIVLEWLKDELNDSYFKAAVSNLFFWVRYDDVEGFPNERSHKMVQAFEELNDKDFGQVLAAFAEWGMKNDK